MATTTGGTTYVTGTDLVASYPTASLALANRVDVVASGGPVLVKTAGYTITVADILSGNKFLYNSASPGTFTFPTSSLVDGMVINVAQTGAGALTVSGGTIVGTTVTTAQYQSLMFVYVASGTTWYSVAPPSTVPGLSVSAPATIANTGGSATLSGGEITFTAVNSVSLNGCFTTTYDNYLCLLSLTSSADTLVRFRMRLSGTDASGSDYNMSYLNPTYAAATDTSGYLTYPGNATKGAAQLYLYGPRLAEMTNWNSYGGNHSQFLYATGRHNVATAYDGITIYPTSGTITGKLRVYGYKNS